MDFCFASYIAGGYFGKNTMVTKQSDEVQIAVLHTDVGYIKKSVDAIDAKIDKFPDRFASKDEVEDIRKNVDSLMKWRYYFTGIAAAIGVIFSKITDYFIQLTAHTHP